MYVLSSQAHFSSSDPLDSKFYIFYVVVGPLIYLETEMFHQNHSFENPSTK